MIIEYGAMSSRYSIEAEDKRAAYVAMCVHFHKNNHLIAIYSPEECLKDTWLNPFGIVSKRLDEVFGGDGEFDRYAESHMDEVRGAYNSIKQLV